MVEEMGLDALFNVMVRFIPDDVALPDEIESHAVAMAEYQRGEIFGDEDIDWN